MADKDGILRHALLYVKDPNTGEKILSMASQTARIFLESRDSSFTLPYINSAGHYYVPFTGKPGAFNDNLSLLKLIQGEIPSAVWKDKIVLIGPYAAALNDYYFTAADKKYDAPFEDMETETDTVFDRAALDSTFCFGADVSSTTLMTRQSKTFYNRSGVKRTVMPILKEQGVNSVRLRVLVNPTGGDFNSTYSKTLATQAKTQGMSIMLDLHYCDWWGDNVKPRAWKSPWATSTI